jgi:hypothetical protein
MNLSFKDQNLWLGLIAGALLVFFLKEKPVLLAPAGETKIASSYMRNGFANLLMAPERRKQFSICYESFVKDREGLKPPTGTDQSAAQTPAGEAKVDAKPTTQLELPPKERVEGSLTYVFQLKENGELIEYELANDEFKDLRFAKCIQAGFKDLRFLPPPLGINRYIAYEMTFKKDETVRREMEERKSSSPLTLVPTPGGEETKIENGEEKPSH